MNAGGDGSCCPDRGPNNGIGYKNSDVDIAGITDGTSNTFLILDQMNMDEEAALKGKGANPFIWMNHDSKGLVVSHQGGSYFLPNTKWDKLAGRVARSQHPGGIQASLCDGSVRFVSETIAINPWIAAFTRNGGESIQLP